MEIISYRFYNPTLPVVVAHHVYYIQTDIRDTHIQTDIRHTFLTITKELRIIAILYSLARKNPPKIEIERNIVSKIAILLHRNFSNYISPNFKNIFIFIFIINQRTHLDRVLMINV